MNNTTTRLNLEVPLPAQTGPEGPSPSRAEPISASVVLDNTGTVEPGASSKMPPQALSLHDGLRQQLPPQPLDAVPIRSPENMRHSAVASVAQAAAQLEALLLSDPVDEPAMAWVLWTLAEDLAPALKQPPAIMDMVLTAALQEMSRCKSLVVRAHLMGACHHLHASASYTSGWGCALRGEKVPTTLRSHSAVLNHYKPLLEDPAQRAEALKAMVVHLSWLAPIWSEGDSISHRRHLDSLRSGLSALFDALKKPYAALSNNAERAAFRDDVLAAFGPATCSRLLAQSLPGVKGIPFWLDDKLLTARERLLASNVAQIFPAERNIQQLSCAELIGRPDAPRDMVRESITSMVDEVATQVEALWVQKDFSALSVALETQARTLAQTLGLPGTADELTHAQTVAQQAMVARGPVVRAGLLGSCGYLQSECVPSSFWRRGLCFDVQKNAAMSYALVFDGYEAEFRDSATRAGAIQGLMVHMSWLAPTPLRGDGRNNDLQIVVHKLFQAMQTESDMAITSEELTAIREDFLAAIVPECCSFLLIPLLSEAMNVPRWLHDPLRLALEQLKTMGGQCFPLRSNHVTSKQAALNQARILLPVLPRLLTRTPLSSAYPRLPVPLAEPSNGLVREELRIKRMVNAAARKLELLFGSGHLVAASAALKTFSQTLEQPRSSDEKLSSHALFVWKTMLDCKPFIAAHMLGTCHFFHTDHSPSKTWPRHLRHSENRKDGVSIGFVIDRHAAQLDHREKRVDALQSMLAHVSWLMPPWYRAGEVENRRKESLEASLRKLVQFVQASYVKLQTSAERSVFLEQMAAAVAPVCCSPLLAKRLKAQLQQDVSPLLRDAFLPVLLKIETDNDNSLFPTQRPLVEGRRKILEKSGPNAVAGSKRPPDGVRDESPAAVPPPQRLKTAATTGAAAAAGLRLPTPPQPHAQMPLVQQPMPSPWLFTQPIPLVPQWPLVPLASRVQPQAKSGQFVVPRRSPPVGTLQTTPFFQAPYLARTVAEASPAQAASPTAHQVATTTTTTTTTSTTVTTTTTEATAATGRTPPATGRR